MKPSEAADLYGVDKKTIYRMVKNGQIKGAKVLSTGTIVIPGNYQEEKEKLNMLSLANRYEKLMSLVDDLEKKFNDVPNDRFRINQDEYRSFMYPDYYLPTWVGGLDWDKEKEKIESFEKGPLNRRLARKFAPQSSLPRQYQKEGRQYLEFQVPGVDKKDLKVEYHQGYIKVSANTKKDDKQEASVYRYSFSEEVGEVTDIVSTLKNGILTVSYKKPGAKEDKPQSIAIG